MRHQPLESDMTNRRRNELIKFYSDKSPDFMHNALRLAEHIGTRKMLEHVEVLEFLISEQGA